MRGKTEWKFGKKYTIQKDFENVKIKLVCNKGFAVYPNPFFALL